MLYKTEKNFGTIYCIAYYAPYSVYLLTLYSERKVFSLSYMFYIEYKDVETYCLSNTIEIMQLISRNVKIPIVNIVSESTFFSAKTILL